MEYQGFFEILMITLISRKIRGGAIDLNMKHTVRSQIRKSVIVQKLI